MNHSNGEKESEQLLRLIQSLKGEGRVDEVTLTTVDETLHDTHFHTIHQSKHTTFLSLFQLSFNTPWHKAIAR